MRFRLVSSESIVRARSFGCPTTSATSLVAKLARASSGRAKRTKWTALSFVVRNNYQLLLRRSVHTPRTRVKRLTWLARPADFQ